MIEIFLPEWFFDKNGLSKETMSLIGKVKAKTDKAILLKCDNFKIWIPKSIILEFKIIKDKFTYQSGLKQFLNEVNE